ncbi:MAG: methionine--tRNA ligase [Terriglobia bacterium]
MAKTSTTFYVTTPIYYANAKPHLGHLYTTLVADTLTRFKRQRGVESFFLTGTDERGVNIERAAAARGIPVQQHVDEIVKEFQDTFRAFNVGYSRWIRTTDDYHREGVRSLWRHLNERGFIYRGEYKGWFCVYCNEFKDVEERAEQPLCPTHERPLEVVSEESYFFKLSEFEGRLLELYRSRPEFVQPESRRNEVISFVAGGLKDLSISRISVKWGIEVPDDARHTIYVWFDALANYITALGWGNSSFQEFERFWPALHLVGKDILRFHAVYWPAFLMAAGIEVPRTVFAHGMWLSGGRKMGKTLGNVIDLPVLRKYFTPDQVRYFCLREMVFGRDGDFTYEALIDRLNADLAAGLGNLSSRTLTMVRNYCDNKIPPSREEPGGEFDGAAAEVRKAIEQAVLQLDHDFERYNFSLGLEAVWAAMARVDKFISDAQPWDLAKDPERRQTLNRVLGTALEAVRHLAVVLAPVLPEGCQAIWEQMGQPGKVAEFSPGDLHWGGLPEGARIGEVKAIFPRIEKGKVMEEIKQGELAAQSVEVGAGEKGIQVATSASPATVPAAVAGEGGGNDGLISIEDFGKVDLRVGTVLTAERIPKADKLLKLTVDIGHEVRQVLAGIALYYAPESLIGLKVVVVTNLAPRKMRGLDSNGMIVAASVGPEGRPVLATFKEEVPNGARLK